VEFRPSRPEHGHSARWALGAALLTWAVLTARMLRFADRTAVDILYYDQWDFWEGLFRGEGPWTLFRWQHGPVRQGLGQLVIQACARASDWDVRFEELVTAGIVSGAALLALAVARLLRGSWSIFDVCVPLIVLTLSQWELFVVTPSPAHGAVPLLCVAAYALALQLERTLVRLPALVAVGFLATYTGFGFFLGPVSIAIVGILLAGAIRDRRAIAPHALALVASMASLASFFWGYHFNPAVACFRFPDPQPLNYLRYLVVLFLRPLESRTTNLAIGFPVLVLVLGFATWAAWAACASLGRSRLHLTLFALTSFSVLFALNLAVGRVCLGPVQAATSRYVPYVVPFVLAGYLALSTGRAAQCATARPTSGSSQSRGPQVSSSGSSTT
jgi:hypothetical protein